MSKTMIDVLVAICRKAAVGDPVSVWGIAQSTKKALERRKLVRRRWLGNTRKGRWVLQPTPLGRAFATAYDLGFGRGQIRQRNDARERIGEVDYPALDDAHAEAL